jgi:hypothetical protein
MTREHKHCKHCKSWNGSSTNTSLALAQSGGLIGLRVLQLGLHLPTTTLFLSSDLLLFGLIRVLGQLYELTSSLDLRHYNELEYLNTDEIARLLGWRGYSGVATHAISHPNLSAFSR